MQKHHHYRRRRHWCLFRMQKGIAIFGEFRISGLLIHCCSMYMHHQSNSNATLFFYYDLFYISFLRITKLQLILFSLTTRKIILRLSYTGHQTLHCWMRNENWTECLLQYLVKWKRFTNAWDPWKYMHFWVWLRRLEVGEGVECARYYYNSKTWNISKRSKRKIKRL